MVAPPAEVTAVKQPEPEAKEVTERKVVLRLKHEKDFVGLNIRGGKEFGLGIYISRYESVVFVVLFHINDRLYDFIHYLTLYS